MTKSITLDRDAIRRDNIIHHLESELDRKQATIDAQAAEIKRLRDACQSAWDVLKDTPNAEVLSKLYAALAESE